MAAGILVLLGAILLIADYRISVTEIETGLVRNSYGEGSRTENLKADVEGEGKAEVQVEVPERIYQAEEVQSLFDRCIRKMDKLILGTNKSPDRIEADMELVTSIPGEPVEISWELSRYDVMNIYGELQEKALVSKGTSVTLNAVLTYSGDPKKQALYECTVMVYPRKMNKIQKQAEKIQAAIREEDEKTKTEEILPLPEKVGQKSVKYYYPMEERGIILIIMGILSGSLLYALDKQNKGKEEQKKEQQMLLDYPEVINKLTLFLGAGMTVKRAWKKVVSDYEEQKIIWGDRAVYEEMKITCHEMDSGVMESESYERFGHRCGLREYIRLGALLSQNLRKGTKGLNQILRLEAIQAFEERKARAKRLGEEAGTKLLGPMFLMLAVVLFIVIVPAFMSMQF